ncbi:MAG: hypothetical protein QOE51_17 [Actinoplanes sp.]|jgi:DNA-binding response OmpR family regulator|nr:hypothetical protein [Actinoplanes sp.]
MSTILLVEDDPDIRHLEQACAVGATDHIVTPFSLRDLLERVESELARVAH